MRHVPQPDRRARGLRHDKRGQHEHDPEAGSAQRGDEGRDDRDAAEHTDGQNEEVVYAKAEVLEADPRERTEEDQLLKMRQYAEQRVQEISENNFFEQGRVSKPSSLDTLVIKPDSSGSKDQ